jgi:hypothetical protein
MKTPDLSGEWISTYHYHDGSDSSSHTLLFDQDELVINGMSLPEPDGSVLSFTLELDADNRALTGTWRESTSPTGLYQGRVFHGAVQFLLNTEFTHAQGKWLGFNSDYSTVNTGDWELQKSQS